MTATSRIMLVDDEPDITFVMMRGLEKHGFTVDTFNSPLEALARFKENYYDMAILDIRMPNMTGFELYRQIRKRDSKIKVAFITAFDIYETEFRKMLPSIDVRLFFKKPMHLNDLAKRVKEELGEEPTLS
jgi:DNA-binding response OmpR family regulator